jgi:release factor glutamine methyltransferase
VQIKQLLNNAIFELMKAGIPTPELDVRILLQEAIKKGSSFVFSHPEYLITNSQYAAFRKFIRRRKAGEPVAYILGHKEFFGLDFKINKNVLIPRPETEWLVEKSIAFLQNQESRIRNQEYKILDIGTGSGCIIISLINSLHNSRFITHNSAKCYATDVSQKALGVARKNAKIHDVKNVHFYRSDLFSNKRLPKRFDLIVANLPYVPHSAKNETIKFEPKEALYADDNGAAIIKKFLIKAKDRINDDGLILLEADCRNSKAISDFAKDQYPQAKVSLVKDLAGIDRYIKIEK